MENFKISKNLVTALFYALFPISLLAGEIKVTSNGKSVSNGDIIQVAYEVMADDSYSEYLWNPQIFISSSEDDIWVDLFAYSDDSDFTICWPNVCRAVMPGMSNYFTGVISEIPSDMQIHRSQFLSNELSPDREAQLKITIYDDDGNPFEFIVKCLSVSSAVEPVDSGSHDASVEWYGLDGRRIDNPKQGIYIRIGEDGSVKKIIR